MAGAAILTGIGARWAAAAGGADDLAWRETSLSAALAVAAWVVGGYSARSYFVTPRHA